MALIWSQVVEKVKPIIVKISTPSGVGTGFILYRSESGGLIAIATAAHVVSEAHHWEQPIRITHFESGVTKLLRHSDRIVRIDEHKDVACIIVNTADFSVSESPLPLIDKGYFRQPGAQVGWLGFPGIYQKSPCFFTGYISCWDDDQEFYLADGVAINGVSGSPAFYKKKDDIEVIGVVSAYWINRQRGEALPGLSQIVDIEWFHNWAQSLRDFEGAKGSGTPSDPSAGSSDGPAPANIDDSDSKS